MTQFFSYLFWPNPGNATYDSPKVQLMLGVCVLLIVIALAISVWRKKLSDARLRKMSGSWAPTCLWLGLTGLLMVVARVEQIQFLAMRFLWVVWIIAALFMVWLQIRLMRARYYSVLPTEKSDDPREKYLPKKKRH